MNDFLGSLKSDLLDRRLLPLLGLLGAALVAAIAYAALAGGSSSTPPAASAPATARQLPGIAVSEVAATKAAVAETTNGVAEQTGGSSRNPFAPMPGAKPAGASASQASTAATGSSTGASASAEGGSGAGSGASTGSEPGSSPSGGTQPSQKKSKSGKSYEVSVLFGEAAPGTPALTAGLTSYDKLQRQQPLPSAEQAIVVFRGVVAGGKSATFTIVGEAIPHGGAACQPSASQCQAIDVRAGETEELEYVPLGGTPVNYELHVVKIERVVAKSAKSAKSAKAASAGGGAGTFGGESKAGLKLLHEAGLWVLPNLRYSRDGSVLVFKGAAHAHAARARARAPGA